MSSSDKPQSKTYQISLNSKQIYLLNKALDLHCRIHAGQISEIQHVLPGPYDHDIVLGLLDTVKTLIFPELRDSQSFGLSAKEESRVTYEMHSDIRRFLAYERNPKGGMTVDFDETFKITKEPPLTIKVVE